MKHYIQERREEGFTLIELLIAIVVVGILTAVVIVGIGGLQDSGSNGACQASKDAAKAAVAVHYNNNDSTYPTTFNQLTSGPKPEMELADGVTPAAAGMPANTTVLNGNGWTLTLGVVGGGAPPTLTCA